MGESPSFWALLQEGSGASVPGRPPEQDRVNLYAMVTVLLAQASQGARPGFRSIDLIMFGTIALIFYFLLIAPARRQRKQLSEMLSGLKNGDKVVTTGGIHGKVVGVTDQIVQLRIADGVKIEVNKSAVGSKQSD